MHGHTLHGSVSCEALGVLQAHGSGVGVMRPSVLQLPQGHGESRGPCVLQVDVHWVQF